MVNLVAPTIVSEQEIFPGDGGQNTWGKTMLKRQLQYPNRNKSDDFYLFHSNKVASIVLPLTPQNEVVAIRIFGQAANEFILQLPGGVRRGSESFEDAARREVLEETGHRGYALTPIGTGWFEPFNTTTPYRAFLLQGCTKEGEPKQEGTELLRVEIYPWEQWWQLCVDGIIEDSKSTTLTIRASKYIK